MATLVFLSIEDEKRKIYAYYEKGSPSHAQLVEAFESIDIKRYRDVTFKPEAAQNLISKRAKLSRWKICEIECAAFYYPKKKSPTKKKVKVEPEPVNPRVAELRRLHKRFLRTKREIAEEATYDD